MRATASFSTPETKAHGMPAMSRAQAQQMLAQLGGWDLRENEHLSLEKTYRFKDFARALDFVNRVGALAEELTHHPDVLLAWGRVTVRIWTHSVKGLTESDFVFAAKCDRLPL